MTKFLLTLFLSLLVSTSWAQGRAKVMVLKGTATFGGRPLSKTSEMQGKGEIVVGDKSYLKILLKESKTVIVLAANSTSNINFNLPPEKEELNLVKGIARWVTGDKKGLGIRTPNAAMGVRGTDFYASYVPESGESELMCFSGTVVFSNVLNPSDSKIVTTSQWGGIGGQYGKKLTEIKDLPPEVISKFDVAIPK